MSLCFDWSNNCGNFINIPAQKMHKKIYYSLKTVIPLYKKHPLHSYAGCNRKLEEIFDENETTEDKNMQHKDYKTSLIKPFILNITCEKHQNFSITQKLYNISGCPPLNSY